jgi:hypothetical protein
MRFSGTYIRLVLNPSIEPSGNGFVGEAVHEQSHELRCGLTASTKVIGHSQSLIFRLVIIPQVRNSVNFSGEAGESCQSGTLPAG